MTKRKYYAEKGWYGNHVSYSSLNRNAYDFLAFGSKQERDWWVDTHDGWNITTVEVVRYCRGRNFKIFKMNGHNIIVRNENEINDYLHGKEV